MLDIPRTDVPYASMGEFWTVKKFVRRNGKIPIDQWMQQKDTAPSQPRIDAKVSLIKRIETSQLLPAETVKKYKSTVLHEFKIKGTKVRALCTIDEYQVILLCGASKTGSGKGKLTKGDVTTGMNLLTEFSANKKSVMDA